ncbi:MAG TPA: DUF1330 domain-containing protein [Clostridia bacterium]|nr:DUF1330 domain-containing protein [Clostridia bacterium]
MSCYFVARILIHDEAEYERYLDKCDEVFARFSGRYLAVDRSPVPLEGTPEEGRMVLIEFPDEAAFRQWYGSPEYREILAHRLAGAYCTSVLVRGKD